MSRTDKTAPPWAQQPLIEYHDHRNGACTLGPKPTNSDEFAAQQSWRSCCWDLQVYKIAWRAVPRGMRDPKFRDEQRAKDDRRIMHEELTDLTTHREDQP